MKHRWQVVVGLMVWLLLSSAWAQDESAELDEPVQIKGNTLTYEQQSNVATATGDAVVTKGTTKLSADSISVNRDTNEMNAKGNVTLQSDQGNIKADAMRVEMENETGDITNGTVTLPRQQYVLTGKSLQKSYGQSYHIENGALTTCQCDDFAKADWSIGGRTIDVNLHGQGTVRDGVFRVRNFPLLYVPYGSAPVTSDRQSGFLSPNYGFSSKRGFVWQQPFYWAINKSYDATVTTDLETSARIGMWGEFRYAPNETTEGILSASYFNERIRGPASTTSPMNRWSVTGAHRQLLGNGWRLYSDLFFVSDDFFLREISHRALNLRSALEIDDWDLRTRRFTDSRAGAVKTWQHALFRGEAAYYQDLRRNQDFAFQELPRLQFQGQRRIWKDRLDVGISIDGADFYRNRGYAGQRLDIAPWIGMPFHLGKYLFGSVKVTGRETIYHMTSEDVFPDSQRYPDFSPLPEGGRLRGDRTRETVQFQAEVGTRISRVFDARWGKLRQLHHVIEPTVSYYYTPYVNQLDLPLYDALDRINKRNLFVYGVDNYILGKFASSTTTESGEVETTQVRELARFSIRHAYDPSRPIGRLGDKYSDLDLSARLQPLPYATFSFDSTYDVARGDPTTIRVGAFLTDPRPLPATSPLLQHLQRRTTVGVSYRTIADRRLLREMNAYVIFRLNDYLTTAYMGRYDFNAASFIGNRYFVRFISPQKCWYVDLGLIDRVNPQELEFRVFFTFVGLSSSGRAAF
ncbi:MAG: LPS-assembly protein LptD [Deltaproteobacteria bacterium]|nr:LPS-assembly protein LptD [Deltaproteobacteria bacterium]